ncbi:MAG TPA: MFS transporter [Planctomycetota bacterium]|nr:MFS transporter [Planctomycetota bacterium]
MNDLNDEGIPTVQKQSNLNIPEDIIEAKKKSLHYSIIEGGAASVMGGFGDSKIGYFAIFLNASNPLIAFLAAFPPVIGTLTQLISVKILDRSGKRKPLILPGVIINMLMWLPIFLLPFLFPAAGPVLLIIAVVVSTGAVNFSIPAWNSLMGDLTEPAKRGRYFAKRNIFVMSFSWISTVAAYGVLEYFKLTNEWIGFGIIFGVAFISRGVSAYYLKKMVEPAYVAKKDDYFSFWDFLRRSPKSNFAHFVFYVALITLAVNISGPFFAVYMIRDLKFSYTQIAIIDTGQIVIQILMMRYWGGLCDRYGNRSVLSFTGWLISFVPILWLISPNFYAIIMFQVFAGLIWSGFSLAAGNFIFDAVSPPKRARCVAYFTLINTLGLFFGSIFGGWISLYLPNQLSLFGWSMVLASSLQVLFLISGLLRLLISSIFLSHIKEVRKVECITTWELIYNFSMIKPVLGPIFDVFTGGKEDKES